MRDPLADVPVRLKLPLTFAFLCVVAFGLGGYLAVTTARAALERQIWLRLDDRVANAHLVIDKSLELLGTRLEDFASDGHIRLELERLQAPGSAGTAIRQQEAEAELVRHLRVNKLSLAPELVDAYILDPDGRLLLRARAEETVPPAGFNREGVWYGPLTAPSRGYPYPTFVISTPVKTLDGARRLGYLQIVVRADVWAGSPRQALARTPLEYLRIDLSSPGGYRLPLIPGAPKGEPAARGGSVPGRLVFARTNARTGWSVDLSVDRRDLTLPIRALVSAFVSMGLALALLSALLLVPARKFLLQPLAELDDAAHRITGGDFSARVGYRSGDEVGHLAAAFNAMAGAVEQRTQELARAAEDLRRQEAEVRRERDRLDTVIHSLEDGLFILGGDGRVTLANAAARDLLRELAQRPPGVPSKGCTLHAEDWGGRPPRSCFQCLTDGRRPAQPCEISIGERVYDIRTTSLRGRGGDGAERVCVSRDVTETTRRAAQQAHQERLSVLGEIAAVIAHEMNNPLAAISMFSQMLRDGLDPSSPLHAHAEVVHRNTLSCARTIRSLLDMAATASADLADFDARDLVDDVVELLRPVAEQSRTALRVDAEAADSLLHADELQLRQALVNLVMNALQAVGRAKGGEVTVGTLERAGDLVIRVRDNGPGIPAGLRDRVFEPFFTTKPAGKGTGLGLPMARRIVETHGGRLILDTGESGGTTFEMVFPHRAVPGEAARGGSIAGEVAS